MRNTVTLVSSSRAVRQSYLYSGFTLPRRADFVLRCGIEFEILRSWLPAIDAVCLPGIREGFLWASCSSTTLCLRLSLRRLTSVLIGYDLYPSWLTNSVRQPMAAEVSNIAFCHEYRCARLDFSPYKDSAYFSVCYFRVRT